MDVRVLADGPRVLVALEGEPVLEAEVDVLGPGRIGVSQWGEALALDGLVLKSDALSAPRDILADATPGAASRALESLCLALLNTNEFLTID